MKGEKGSRESSKRILWGKEVDKKARDWVLETTLEALIFGMSVRLALDLFLFMGRAFLNSSFSELSTLIQSWTSFPD